MRGLKRNTVLTLSTLFVTSPATSHPGNIEVSSQREIISSYVGFSERNESRFVKNPRQLIYEGERSSEGYFHSDGRTIVFQSERYPDNPFFQIYKMNLESGNTDRVSSGVGQASCASIHPSGQKVLFSSTHLDPRSIEKQRLEYERRSRGEQRSSSDRFDPEYEIFVKNQGSVTLTNLTNINGFDSEASYSPDGQWIAFSSNRIGYSGELSPEEQAKFDLDPSYGVDIYLMKADGTSVRRLTTSPGYDGGAFFSPDGTKITWRKFTDDGRTAEIWTMNLDGSGQKQLTNLGKMSWSPYFHPSGDYIVFATNIHGHDNFELYMVRTDGVGDPVRITETEGFDGMPVFSPDGEMLMWTSTRTAKEKGQLFIAEWDGFEARAALALGVSMPGHEKTEPAIQKKDAEQHIEYLASEALAGRNTGTEGERLAGEYIQSGFINAGLTPAGDFGTFVESFVFTSGASLGENNAILIGRDEMIVDEDFRPLAYSEVGGFDFSQVVFAGYGFRIPADQEFEGYDSYFHLDVENKWVMALRFIPNNITKEERRRFNRYADIRRKAKWARDLGAKGIIFVTGPMGEASSELIPLKFNASAGSMSIKAISVTNETAERLLVNSEKNLSELQAELDNGELVSGFEVSTGPVDGEVDIATEVTTGRNIIGKISANSKNKKASGAIMIGAHYDHLGAWTGAGRTSDDGIFVGADDNASGTAGMLEIAQHISSLVKQGKIELKKDLLFAAWSGEEIGLLGSSHYATKRSGRDGSLYSKVGAYLNMDMIGRLEDKAILQGVGSSKLWRVLIEQANASVGLAMELSNDPYLPTDSTSFYLKKVPTLNAFTGGHDDYHTPFDTADKIDYNGVVRVAQLMANIVKKLAVLDESPDYQEIENPNRSPGRFEVTLGIIPAYDRSDVKGLFLNGVKPNGPADKAGLKAGDIIVELDGLTIENIYDYTEALSGLKPDEAVSVKVQRGTAVLEFSVTPTR